MTNKTEELDPRERRKVRQKALAFLRRGRKAEIPEEHLCINSEDFSKLLDKQYIADNVKGYKEIFGDEYSAWTTKEFSDNVYANVGDILKKEVVIIDGGNAAARRRAGFAMLFRAIVNDKWGLYKEAVELAHKFEMIDSSLSFTRNDWVDALKTQDVIFLSEFEPSFFNEHFWVGSFFDEFLVPRSMGHRLTIVSFSQPISKENIITNSKCGRCMADFSARMNPSRKAFRIKVKPYEPK